MPSKPTQKSSKRAPTVGDVVCITFYDHAENSKDAILFRVYGEVFDVTRLAYRLRCWGYVDDVERATGNPDNEHGYTIVKRAIKDIKVLT